MYDDGFTDTDAQMMTTPSTECRKGNHISTEIRPGVTRCAWCGHLEEKETAKSDTTEHVQTQPAQPSCCGDARQANYPRPTITERHDSVAIELDTRFRVMARGYARDSAALVSWQTSGNTLPEVYR